MRDLVPVHAGLDQIHEGARTEIEQNLLVRTHQIAGRSTSGMDVGTGAKNSESHGKDRNDSTAAE
ncbi:MAG: hypothetical protein HC938_15890 [Nitrospira sp.]|nr:hypothetical protein [Nitrospira sp.]